MFRGTSTLDWFDTISESGRVQRFHNFGLNASQDVAQHSFNCALMAYHLASEINATRYRYYGTHQLLGERETVYINPQRVAMYMLSHDMAELETGDIPGPFKNKHPVIKQEMDMAEDDWKKHNFPQSFQDYLHSMNREEIILCKFVDLFECWLTVLRDVENGNRRLISHLVEFVPGIQSIIDSSKKQDHEKMTRVLTTISNTLVSYIEKNYNVSMLKFV